MFGRKKKEPKRAETAKRIDDRDDLYARACTRMISDRRLVDETAAERLANLPEAHSRNYCPKCESRELVRTYCGDRVLARRLSIEWNCRFGEQPNVMFASPVSVLEVRCKDCGFRIGDERTADES